MQSLCSAWPDRVQLWVEVVHLTSQMHVLRLFHFKLRLGQLGELELNNNVPSWLDLNRGTQVATLHAIPRHQSSDGTQTQREGGRERNQEALK